MAYTGCVDSVCRVEGKGGLALGEKQGRFQRAAYPGASINYDGGQEKSGVNTIIDLVIC